MVGESPNCYKHSSGPDLPCPSSMKNSVSQTSETATLQTQAESTDCSVPLQGSKSARKNRSKVVPGATPPDVLSVGFVILLRVCPTRTDLYRRTTYKHLILLAPTQKLGDRRKGTRKNLDVGTGHSRCPLSRALQRTRSMTRKLLLRVWNSLPLVCKSR